MGEGISADAVIDGKTFTEYALFDVMGRQKRWIRPLLFAAIFSFFSLVAFSRRGTDEQAALLGWVLLAVGLLLPLVYLLSFFLSVRQKSRTMDGTEPAYTLELGEKGLTVRKQEQVLHFSWKELYAAHRLKNSICLYADARHAFLLPQSCGAETCRAAWDMIVKNLDPEKQRDHHNKRNRKDRAQQ